MTVIGVPVINRPDLLRRFLDSVDRGNWDPVVIINATAGADYEALYAAAGSMHGRSWIVTSPGNLGVAASWNFIIRTHPSDSWWCIANADAELTPGDLDRLAAEMEKPGPRWVGMNGDWRVFGINRECVDAVGLFDENYYPIYCEDADYERRCGLAGVPWYHVAGGATHVGSAAIRSGYGEANQRTYPRNVAYFTEKWGGPVRQGTYTTPFNRGGSVRDWTLDVQRLRELEW